MAAQQVAWRSDAVPTPKAAEAVVDVVRGAHAAGVVIPEAVLKWAKAQGAGSKEGGKEVCRVPMLHLPAVLLRNATTLARSLARVPPIS
jgi:hypothetical protein